MTVFVGKRCGQPCIHNGEGQILRYYAGAKCHHIGVVVQTGHSGGCKIRKKGATNASDLVGGNGNANAGGTKHNAPVTVAVSYRLSSGHSIIRIVTALRGIGAKIFNRVAQTSEERN